jgi:hypothetical protein
MQRELFDMEDRSISALLHRAVERHWHYSNPCLCIHWQVDEADGVLTCEAAPCIQEILGGGDDGCRAWSPFAFDVIGFTAEPDIEIEQVAFESLCIEYSRMPGLTIRGRFHAQPFALRLHEEPICAEPREHLDAINQRIVPIKEKRRPLE